MNWIDVQILIHKNLQMGREYSVQFDGMSVSETQTCNSSEETDKCQDILDWIVYLLRWKRIIAFSQYSQYYGSHICC
jgi:hypothetical protein